MVPPPLFVSPRFRVRELDAGEVPHLQALFDANPEYFVAINGSPAPLDAARREFDDLPPPHLSYARRWICGVFDRDAALQGVLEVLADLVVPGVWHVGLFLLATPLHGSGAAAELHAALEDWMVATGARWLRLGVVVGNTRAERFWQRLGYREVRRRERVDTGGRLNTVRVLVKPVGEETLARYLERVERDRPDSTLP